MKKFILAAALTAFPFSQLAADAIIDTTRVSASGLTTLIRGSHPIFIPRGAVTRIHPDTYEVRLSRSEGDYCTSGPHHMIPMVIENNRTYKVVINYNECSIH